jgi:hypothetical protein
VGSQRERQPCIALRVPHQVHQLWGRLILSCRQKCNTLSRSASVVAAALAVQHPGTKHMEASTPSAAHSRAMRPRA